MKNSVKNRLEAEEIRKPAELESVYDIGNAILIQEIRFEYEK